MSAVTELKCWHWMKRQALVQSMYHESDQGRVFNVAFVSHDNKLLRVCKVQTGDGGFFCFFFSKGTVETFSHFQFITIASSSVHHI